MQEPSRTISRHPSAPGKSLRNGRRMNENHPVSPDAPAPRKHGPHQTRSEEHTSELQSLMRISYAVFCLKKKNTHTSTLSTRRTLSSTPTFTHSTLIHSSYTTTKHIPLIYPPHTQH